MLILWLLIAPLGSVRFWNVTPAKFSVPPLKFVVVPSVVVPVAVSVPALTVVALAVASVVEPVTDRSPPTVQLPPILPLPVKVGAANGAYPVRSGGVYVNTPVVLS